MSEVDNNSSVNAAPVSNLQISQLERLERDLHGKLQERRQSLSQTGLVNDISEDTQVQTIQKALTQVQEARAQVDPRVTNHLARAGQFGNVAQPETHEVSSDSINAREAAQIKAIRSVSGMELSPGQQFASLSGREPSLNEYTSKNKKGLFELIALRELDLIT